MKVIEICVLFLIKIAPNCTSPTIPDFIYTRRWVHTMCVNVFSLFRMGEDSGVVVMIGGFYYFAHTDYLMAH